MADEKKKRLKEVPYPYNFIEVLREQPPLGVDIEEWNLMDYTPSAVTDLLNDSLNSRERQIIEMRYRDKQSCEEIGCVYGITRERVRQIENNAIRKLYNPGILKEYASVPYHEWREEREARERAEERLDWLLQHGVQDVDIDTDGRTHIETREDITIDKLYNSGMSLRSYNCLRKAGLLTAGDIIKQSEESLVNIKNLGRKSFNEIVKFMHQLGLKMIWESDIRL